MKYIFLFIFLFYLFIYLFFLLFSGRDAETAKKCTKEIKNAPSALLSYTSTREFLRTREKPSARASRTSRVFLKIPECLYNSTMHEEQVFYFFYKIKTTTKGQEFVRQQI